MTLKSKVLAFLCGYLVVMAFFSFLLLVNYNSGTGNGKCMEPNIHDGDIIYFTPWAFCSRGDVVIFVSLDENGYQNMISKRIIGVEGDRIQFDGQNYFVNGKKLEPNYTISNDKVVSEKIGEWIVGDEMLFLAGDNYDDSYDSRDFGPVNRDNIIGRVYWVSTGN